jgi:hypothetical protein
MQHEYFIDPRRDYAVIGFVYSIGGVPIETLDMDLVETKKSGQWVLRGWMWTLFDKRGQTQQVHKIKVTSFAEDVKIGENNKFDIAPPEGAKVGRSHYEWPVGAEAPKLTSYGYEMKNGKLVQIAGPEPPLWDRVRDNVRWFALAAGLAAAAFVGARIRRGWIRGPMTPPASGG